LPRFSADGVVGYFPNLGGAEKWCRVVCLLAPEASGRRMSDPESANFCHIGAAKWPDLRSAIHESVYFSMSCGLACNLYVVNRRHGIPILRQESIT
jgi:hypothetical protein